MAKRKKKAKETRRKPVKISKSEREKSDETPDFIKKTLRAHRKIIEERLERAEAKKGDKPLSETLEGKVSQIDLRTQEKMTADDCCAILQGMAHNEPARVISRNYFRNHSGIKESTWNRHFGTFHEFKRQAGVVLTRHVHKLERELAKHASADHYRAMSEARKGLDVKYVKHKSGRWKTLLVASDLHDVDCDPFALRVFLETAKAVSPVVTDVVLAGDVFDLPEFGRFTQDPRDWDVVGRINFVHDKVLKPLRSILPAATVWWIEGNHEARLLRHLADATPAMRAVLSDLHGFTIPKLLKLDEYEINYIGKGDLAARTWRQTDHKNELSKNYKVFYDCFLVHHFPEGKKMNMPGCHGHHHSHEVDSFYSPIYGAYEWHQVGCLHTRDASYTDGQRWNNGFGIVDIDTATKAVQWEYITVGDFARVAGQPLYRKKSEVILSEVQTSL